MKRVITTSIAVFCCFIILFLAVSVSANAISTTPLTYQKPSNSSTNQTNALYKGVIGAMSALIIGLVTLPFRLISEKNKKKKAELAAQKAGESIARKMIFFCRNCGYTESGNKEKRNAYCPQCKHELIRTYITQNEWDNLSIKDNGKERARLFQKSISEDNENLKDASMLQSAICSNCGYILPDGAKFCTNCGRAVFTGFPIRYCRFCGNKVKAGNMFCPQCGNRIGKD